MLVVLPFYSGDREQAVQLSDWLNELGPYPNHELLIVRKGAAPVPDMGKSFGKVSELLVHDGIKGWPHGPNSTFRAVAKHIEFTMPQPWFWLEPDAILLRASGFDEIAAEYQIALSRGKPFMGDFVHRDMPGFIDHMSGVGVYPGKITALAGLALISHDTAWDCAAAGQILPRMHRSKLIQHLVEHEDDITRWRHQTFLSMEQVRAQIRPEAVLFHASKDGSLIALLRAERSRAQVFEISPNGPLAKAREKTLPPDNLSAPVLAEHATAVEIAHGTTAGGEARESTVIASETDPGPRGAQTFDILIKSYPKDYEWLSYCLRAIDKFASGFRRVTIVIPKGSLDGKFPLGAGMKNEPKIIETVEAGEPYLYQGAVKASAHEFTDADYVLHIDSDVILNQPVTPESFFRDGKPIWYMTPYEVLRQGLEEVQRANPGLTRGCGVMEWKRITEKFLGEAVEFEFMRRFPLLIPRFLHQWATTFCLEKHGVRLTDYILSQPGREFSEFNALGALAWSRFPAQVHWIDTTKETLPEPFAFQFWSYGGITPEIKEKLDTILSGGGVSPTPVKTPSTSEDSAQTNNRTSVDDVTTPAAQTIRQTKDGHWIISEDSHISRWVEETGRLDHDQNLLPDILPEIPAGGTVVDVGAHIGSHTIAYLNAVGETGKVIAIEPNLDAWDCLRRNCPRANIRASVLWDKNAAKLNLIKDKNAGATYVQEDAGGALAGTTLLVATTLDALLKAQSIAHVDFIKLDVEGCEVRVLRGAEKTIVRHRPKLLIEVNREALQRQGFGTLDLFAWLEDHGYENRIVQSNCTYLSELYDILCKPREGGDASCRQDSTILGDNAEIPTTSKAVPTFDPEGAAEAFNSVPESGWPRPWASSLESIEEIKHLASRLKSFCTAPAYTRRVRDELAAVGLTKAAVVKRRRKRK